jgi:hypothetical protein
MAFEFDPNKSLDEHIAEFRKHLEAIDPQCAKILFDNQGSLLSDGNPYRARTSRTAFNITVLKQLQALIPKGGAS